MARSSALALLMSLSLVATCVALTRVQFNRTSNVIVSEDLYVHGIEAVYADAVVACQRPMLHKQVSLQYATAHTVQQRMSQQTMLSASATATVQTSALFTIEYNGSPPVQVQGVVAEACSIWSDVLNTESVTVPITMRVTWDSLASNVLGSAGPAFGWLYQNRYYPDALINQLTGIDQDSSPDIFMTLNSNFAGWHLDLATPPPSGTHDMLSVVVHEIGHGLGVIGFIGSGGSYAGNQMDPFAYDAFVYNSAGQRIVDVNSMSNPSLMEQRVTDSNGVFYEPKPASVDQHIRLYAPPSFVGGSSVYHLDESTYPPGHADSLMTPQLNSAERIAAIGPRALEVLEATGWDIRDCGDYAANCEVCAMADCVWCPSSTPSGAQDGMCVRNDAACVALGSGYDASSTVDMAGACAQCTSDADCDDPLDQCRVGQCDTETGRCVYTEIVCYDGLDCTSDFCDSTRGCVFFDSDNECTFVSECGEAEGRVSAKDILSIHSFSTTVQSADDSEVTLTIDHRTAQPYYNTANDVLVEDMRVDVLFDKVDGQCGRRGEGNVYANEVFARLELLDNNNVGVVRKSVQLIATGSYVRNGAIPRSHLVAYNSEALDETALLLNVSFTDHAAHSVKSLYPDSGLFRPVEPLVSAFKGESIYQAWRLVLGDSSRGDPVCLYNFTIAFTVQLANATQGTAVPSLSGENCVLCSAENGSDDLRGMLQDPENDVVATVRFDDDVASALKPIPANFFELHSDPVLNKQFYFSLCDAASNKALTLQTLTDALVPLQANGMVLVNVRANSVRLCADRPLTVSYDDGRGDELWDMEAVLSSSVKTDESERSYGTLVLETYPACTSAVVDACAYGGTCELSLYAKLKIVFYRQGFPRTAINTRVLDEDTPPEYQLITQTLFSGRGCTWQSSSSSSGHDIALSWSNDPHGAADPCAVPQ